MNDEEIKRRLMASLVAFNIVVILYMAYHVLFGPRVALTGFFVPFLWAVGLGVVVGGIVFAVMTAMKL